MFSFLPKLRDHRVILGENSLFERIHTIYIRYENSSSTIIIAYNFLTYINSDKTLSLTKEITPKFFIFGGLMRLSDCIKNMVCREKSLLKWLQH